MPGNDLDSWVGADDGRIDVGYEVWRNVSSDF